MSIDALLEGINIIGKKITEDNRRSEDLDQYVDSINDSTIGLESDPFNVDPFELNQDKIYLRISANIDYHKVQPYITKKLGNKIRHYHIDYDPKQQELSIIHAASNDPEDIDTMKKVMKKMISIAELYLREHLTYSQEN